MIDDKLTRKVVYRLFTSLKDIQTLHVSTERTGDQNLYRQCMNKFIKDYDSSLPELTVFAKHRIRKVFWKSPVYFRQDMTSSYDTKTEDSQLVINDSFYQSKNSTDVYHYSAEEIKQGKHLHLCENQKYLGFQSSLAALELLDDYQLNPRKMLWGTTLEAMSQETFLQREAIRFRTQAICTSFLGFTPVEDIYVFGDYQEHLVDVETGILLERRIIIDNKTADLEKVTEIQVNTEIDLELFTTR
jgi:hypothetical protein